MVSAEELDDDIDIPFPFWVKPIKSHSSQLGFEVPDAETFASAVQQIREEIGRIPDPFDRALARVEVPGDIRMAGGRTCLAEEIVTRTGGVTLVRRRAGRCPRVRPARGVR
ncbi:hypothetical protein ACFWPH_16660 [Nocardia sp. NPDC058499]|uniref:hypothetical protein n=1 Tax=Nocardia sp. NPDC058499 TaxID=3346530 RepID=UPI003664A3EE